MQTPRMSDHRVPSHLKILTHIFGIIILVALSSLFAQEKSPLPLEQDKKTDFNKNITDDNGQISGHF
jgi:hypothetical protein